MIFYFKSLWKTIQNYFKNKKRNKSDPFIY